MKTINTNSLHVSHKWLFSLINSAFSADHLINMSLTEKRRFNYLYIISKHVKITFFFLCDSTKREKGKKLVKRNALMHFYSFFLQAMMMVQTILWCNFSVNRNAEKKRISDSNILQNFMSIEIRITLKII